MGKGNWSVLSDIAMLISGTSDRSAEDERLLLAKFSLGPRVILLQARWGLYLIWARHPVIIFLLLLITIMIMIMIVIMIVIMTRRSGTPAHPPTRLSGSYGRLAGEGWGLLRSNSPGECDSAIRLEQNILSRFAFCLITYLELQLHYWNVGSCIRVGAMTMRKNCKMQPFLET